MSVDLPSLSRHPKLQIILQVKRAMMYFINAEVFLWKVNALLGSIAPSVLERLHVMVAFIHTVLLHFQTILNLRYPARSVRQGIMRCLANCFVCLAPKASTLMLRPTLALSVPRVPSQKLLPFCARIVQLAFQVLQAPQRALLNVLKGSTVRTLCFASIASPASFRLELHPAQAALVVNSQTIWVQQAAKAAPRAVSQFQRAAIAV